MDLILERYKEGPDNVIVDALWLSTYACPFLLSIWYETHWKGAKFQIHG